MTKHLVGDRVRFHDYAQGERPPAGAFRVTLIDGDRVNIRHEQTGAAMFSVPSGWLRGAGQAQLCGHEISDGNADDPSYAYCGEPAAHAGDHGSWQV